MFTRIIFHTEGRPAALNRSCMKKTCTLFAASALFILITSLALPPSLSLADQETDNATKESSAYRVKKHDTLWDISAKKMKSAEKWPALWGKNPQIRNPHWIYPGETIYLDNNNIPQQQAEIPNDASGGEISRTDVNPPYFFFYPLMDSVGYIKDHEERSFGRIISCMPSHQKDIDEGNTVYLNMKNEKNLMVGDQFQVVRTFYVKDIKSVPQVQHYITGIVEITKLKPEPCKCHEQVSQIEGRIVKAYRTILANDILLPLNSVDSKVPVRKSAGNMFGSILFSEEHTKKIGENDIVFIDKGKTDGLKTGQFYDIFNHPRGTLVDPAHFAEKTEYVGSLVVIRMENETSSALITYAYKDIVPGDIMVSPASDNSYDNITSKGDYRY